MSTQIYIQLPVEQYAALLDLIELEIRAEARREVEKDPTFSAGRALRLRDLKRQLSLKQSESQTSDCNRTIVSRSKSTDRLRIQLFKDDQLDMTIEMSVDSARQLSHVIDTLVHSAH